MRKRVSVLALCVTLLLSVGGTLAWLAIESVQPAHVNFAAPPNEAPQVADQVLHEHHIPTPRPVEPLRGYLRGFVSGRVMSEHGIPIPDARVVAGVTHLDRFPGNRGKEAEFPFLREFLYRGSTTTDNQGSYTLSFTFTVEDGVESAPMYLWATKHERCISVEVVQVRAATDYWDVDLSEVEPASVTGVLIDAHGRPITNRWISCICQLTGESSGLRTSDRGAFRFDLLRPTEYRLEVARQMVLAFTPQPGSTHGAGVIVFATD